MSKFSKRSKEKEIMDDLDCSGPVLEQTLRELKIINRWLGGNQVPNWGLKSLIQAAVPQSNYQVMDLGCGGGDMIAVMDSWAKKNKLSIQFIGADANAHTIEFAKQRQQEVEGVEWQVVNAFDPKFLEEQVDFVTCTLFTHHFTDEELIQLFLVLKKKARIGFVINDLHRHPLAYYAIKWLTASFSKSPMVQHDAPLSVLRSFTRKDWRAIFLEAGLYKTKIQWRWAFRWQIEVTI